MGTEGYREMIVNSRGREIGKPTYEQQAREGTGLQLTIDADLQKAAEDGFAPFWRHQLRQAVQRRRRGSRSSLG